ncbi:MAG: urease accessory protein UreF [Deltaproteobacteria bacterium]|nr:MAG: urease accessory protein UreF [Deltaproteobacteria bacterium]TMB28967.1 MAG: urease accessory protein UreF [Deltaproteobacteria bacterium]TMB30714.1 MAG: urease accessory protein UreF [Deltaproteobacteria bacterium]
MPVPWILLQLSDSALPTGGFVHSAGLESAFQQGEVQGPGDLRRFILDAIWLAGHSSLPLASGAHEDPDSLPALDARADAFLSSEVANRASRLQGRAFLDACARIFPAELSPLREQAARLHLRRHFAPVFGVALRALHVSLEETQQLLLSLAARGLLQAAVRLGAAGTHEAQRLLRDLSGAMDEVLASCAHLREGDLAQTAPLADLLGAMHDRLYSRLFQS